jgi:UDP:flavonoid glycosyltransferase YjiC (YdhE family)
MKIRVGILPHADLPHVLPCFRLARELLKYGHDVRLLGSDVYGLGRGHSQAWGSQLGRFGLAGREVVHKDRGVKFFNWFPQQVKELGLDVLILDAVWQGLAFDCRASEVVANLVVHYSGLPDFRPADMPAWRFVHPGHSRQAWEEARSSMAKNQAVGAFRTMFSSVRSLSGGGTASSDDYATGCTDFATLPAVRAVSLCPALEFPEERGRVEYFGTLLPTPQDVDWAPLSRELSDPSLPLIACVFGTTSMLSKEERQWMRSTATSLARSFPHCQVVCVIPGRVTGEQIPQDAAPNVLWLPWVPLWELLATRRNAKVLVSTPGIGAFREAMASATPIVAIPRQLDQFGAAARVEFFKVGAVLVSRQLPAPQLVMRQVAHVLENQEFHLNAERLRQDCAAYDATLPLKRFLDKLVKGFPEFDTADFTV